MEREKIVSYFNILKVFYNIQTYCFAGFNFKYCFTKYNF